MVPIISNDECLRWHHHKGIDVKLYQEMFCAGHSEGKMDACLVRVVLRLCILSNILPVLLAILCCFPLLLIQMYEHLIFFPQGDSGGPLVVHHNGRWVLSGITSAGFGCAVDHQPGIYHKVSVTSGWLAANVRP